MSAAQRIERPWMRRTGLAGVVDGGTGAVLLLWAVLFALLPDRPGVDDVSRPPAPVCMITAWPVPLADLPLALRPDLITLPSAVSFGAAAPAADALIGVPPFRYPMERPLPLPATLAGDGEGNPAGVCVKGIQSAAVQEAGRVQSSDLRYLASSAAIPVSLSGRIVLYSEGLGQTQLKDEALKGLGNQEGGRRVESELWVAFDAAGRPSEIFLEKGGGDPAADRELVRTLWNPASWTQAAGRGRISIR
jgi:hypothetical protein